MKSMNCPECGQLLVAQTEEVLTEMWQDSLGDHEGWETRTVFKCDCGWSHEDIFSYDAPGNPCGNGKGNCKGCKYYDDDDCPF
jgi:RNase P subunit RPR2